MSGREPLFHKTTVQNDLDELRKQSRADALDEHLPEKQIAQFEAVTRAMQAALADKPTLDLAEIPGEELRWAIAQIFVARTGRDPVTTGHVSALDRSSRFNRALAILQPVLAAALRPDFLQGRAVYAALTGQVSSLRQTITRGIIAETMPRKKPRAKVEAQDDDDEPRGDGSDGDKSEKTSDEDADHPAGRDEPGADDQA